MPRVCLQNVTRAQLGKYCDRYGTAHWDKHKCWHIFRKSLEHRVLQILNLKCEQQMLAVQVLARLSI